MKVGLLITARLKSSRLPFKLLRDLNGFSIIEHVINRSKQVYGVDDIVLCTSSNPQDKPLLDVAKLNDIYYYLGSEEDVLHRLYKCSKFFGFDYILSITGENPLFSIEHANMMVDRIKTYHEDFLYIEDLPIGCGVYGLNVKALKTICAFKKEIDTEIWGPLVNRPEIFKIGRIKTEEFYKRPQLRLTNDYFEDYVLMQEIFDSFRPQSIPSLYSVLKLLDSNPSLLMINKDLTQMGLSQETIDRINTFFVVNHKSIMELKNNIYKNDNR